tara:strand:- start:3067 stop:3537 length:471 start_codon:yes stop_codon:yes gene_type:complete
MPNHDFINKDYVVPDNLKKELGDKISGNNITTRLSRLKSKENLTELEEEIFNWLNAKHDGEIKKIDGVKRIIMKTKGVGSKKGGNAFKDTHTKDKDNANPTKIGGMVKINSSGKHSKVSDQIENNRLQYYESYESEIEAVRYLIEYMNNNKDNKIL